MLCYRALNAQYDYPKPNAATGINMIENEKLALHLVNYDHSVNLLMFALTNISPSCDLDNHFHRGGWYWQRRAVRQY